MPLQGEAVKRGEFWGCPLKLRNKWYLKLFCYLWPKYTLGLRAILEHISKWKKTNKQKPCSILGLSHTLPPTHTHQYTLYTFMEFKIWRCTFPMFHFFHAAFRQNQFTDNSEPERDVKSNIFINILCQSYNWLNIRLVLCLWPVRHEYRPAKSE